MKMTNEEKGRRAGAVRIENRKRAPAVGTRVKGIYTGNQRVIKQVVPGINGPYVVLDTGAQMTMSEFLDHFEIIK